MTTRTGPRASGALNLLPWCLTCSMFTIAGAPAAMAQEARSESSSLVLEEIIVTAQKRAQNLQDVPISVSVINGDKISSQNLLTLEDLSRTQPAVSIAPAGRGMRLSVRGVASGTATSFEQSVVTFVDDIYHGKGRSAGAILLDIDRIEVLKGPQTTFFGNNAIGGAINIQTAKPKKDFGGSVRALYGTDGEYALEGILNLPVNDTLALRGAALANGMDGYLDDRSGGTKVPHERNGAARLSALWQPTDEFQLDVKAEGSDNRAKGGIVLQLDKCPPNPPFTMSVRPGYCAALLSQGADGKLNDVRDHSPGQFLNMKTQDYRAAASYDFGPATLTAVSGYAKYNFTNFADLDQGPQPLAGISAPQNYHQFSQELRIASEETGPVSYLAGVYYQTSKFEDTVDTAFNSFSPTILSSGPPTFGAYTALAPYLPLGQRVSFTFDEKTLSGFGSVTWRVTDPLSLTAALRASKVKKDFSQIIYYGQGSPTSFGTVLPYGPVQADLASRFANSLSLGAAGPAAGTRSDSKVMPAFNIQYKLSSDVNLYGSYTEGFKSGGFNGANNTGDASKYRFEPETVKNYEVGLRSELFGNRLLFNASVFYTDYKNLQVSIVRVINGSASTVITNAAVSVSKGIELESKFAVTEALSVGSAITLLDARYSKFPNATATTTQKLTPGVLFQDLSGRPRSFAPKFSGTFYVNYKQPITTALNIELGADLLYQSYYYTADQDDPNLAQDGYAKLDLRAALSSADSKWELALIAKNVTDETILNSGSDSADPGSFIVTKERPRSFAAQLRYKW